MQDMNLQDMKLLDMTEKYTQNSLFVGSRDCSCPLQLVAAKIQLYSCNRRCPSRRTTHANYVQVSKFQTAANCDNQSRVVIRIMRQNRLSRFTFAPLYSLIRLQQRSLGLSSFSCHGMHDICHVLQFHVLHFHAFTLGPSFSCPAISCPAFSINPSSLK